MKKAITYWFVFLALMLGLSFTTSCKSKQPENKTVEIKNDSLIEKKEVKKIIEISKAIKDSSAIKMPDIETGVSKECDSLCNKNYQAALSSINFYKKSGANMSKTFYDKETKMLYTITEMEEIINEKSDSISRLINIIDSKKEKSKIVVKNVYPKWLIIISLIGFLTCIYWSYRISRIFI